MARPARVRAVDLPAARTQLRALARAYIARGDAVSPDQLREFDRQFARDDLSALWWVSRRMSVLAAHEAQTIPRWDAVTIRPAVAGLLAWEGGSGISLPVWRPGRVRPEQVEALGVAWWTLDAGEHVTVEPLVRGNLSGWGDLAAGMLLATVDHQSPLTDETAVREAAMRVADLWATSVVLALEPKLGVLHQQRPAGAGPRGTGRPKHRSSITVVELRRHEQRQIHHDEEVEGKKWSLDHQVPVRGHWRQQACGPAHQWRKPVYVLPHFRGPAEADPPPRHVVHVWRR